MLRVDDAELRDAAWAGKALGLSKRAVYDLAASGILTHYRTGAGRGAVRFHPDDIAAYRQGCRFTGTSERAAGATNSTTTSVASAVANENSCLRAGPALKLKPSTARKARPCLRSPPALPALGILSTRLSLVSRGSEPQR